MPTTVQAIAPSGAAMSQRACTVERPAPQWLGPQADRLRRPARDPRTSSARCAKAARDTRRAWPCAWRGTRAPSACHRTPYAPAASPAAPSRRGNRRPGRRSTRALPKIPWSSADSSEPRVCVTPVSIQSAAGRHNGRLIATWVRFVARRSFLQSGPLLRRGLRTFCRGVGKVSDVKNSGAVAFPSGKFASLSLAQKLLVLAFLGVGAWYLSWRPTAFNLGRAGVLDGRVRRGDLRLRLRAAVPGHVLGTQAAQAAARARRSDRRRVHPDDQRVRRHRASHGDGCAAHEAAPAKSGCSTTATAWRCRCSRTNWAAVTWRAARIRTPRPATSTTRCATRTPSSSRSSTPTTRRRPTSSRRRSASSATTRSPSCRRRRTSTTSTRSSTASTARNRSCGASRRCSSA